jgi:TolB protein
MARGGVGESGIGRPRLIAALLAGLVLATPGTAAAARSPDVFNGRIAFSSFRTGPNGSTGDIFSFNADGTDRRQLTSDPADDAQADWAPDGADIVYRIRKPLQRTNYEVARMPAAGGDRIQLTTTPGNGSSSQPSWWPDKAGFLYRFSAGRESSIWQMGPLGENPQLRYDPPGRQWYPSYAPDMKRVLFATTVSPNDDSDRGVFTLDADGSNLTTLFDVAGAFDSAPAWSPSGRQVAFESSADIAGGNPERDAEIWVMHADGSLPRQLTHNSAHDEGPAWSPDGRLLAFTSGPDNLHGDIHLMTARGRVLRRLTDYAGRDESPDWQAIPAPRTDRRCGDLALARDIRAAGRRLSCRRARTFVRRWFRAGAPERHGRWRAHTTDFGGTLRVVLARRHGGADDYYVPHRKRRLVAFLLQAAPS